MKFLKKYYDKIIFCVLLIALTAFMTLQTLSLQRARNEVKIDEQGIGELVQGKEKIPDLDKSVFDANPQIIQTRLWKKRMGEGTLFDPPRYVAALDRSDYILHYSTRINPFTLKMDIITGKSKTNKIVKTENSLKIPTGTKDTDNDGMPDEWEKAYKLNTTDASDAKYDKDKDGFSNEEEYRWGKTSPIDPSAHPDLSYLLRYYKKSIARLPFILSNIMALPGQDIATWEITLKLKKKRHGRIRWEDVFLKIGKTIPGTKYKIITARRIKRKGIQGDTFEIDIQQNGEDVLTLTKGKPAIGPRKNTIYYFVYLIGKKPKLIRLTENKTFILKDLQGNSTTYRLLINENGTFQAENIKTGKKNLIPHFNKQKDLKRISEKRNFSNPMLNEVPKKKENLMGMPLGESNVEINQNK